MPSFVEFDIARDLVECFETRRQPGFDGVLGENPSGESVQGGDGGAVESVERAAQRRLGVLAGRRREQSIEHGSDAVA